MDLNSTIDIIIKDLREAGEIIDDLKKYPGVPALQVELAKSKCRSAAEVIAMLKNLQAQIMPVTPEKQQPAAQAVTEEKKENPERQEKQIIPDSEPQKVITTVKDEPVKEEPVAETSVKNGEKIKKMVKRPSDQAIIADQFSDRPESFNEKLRSMKQESDLLEVLRTKPLSSLNEAIGINDKFLFIREIFNGNSDDYNRAIQKLESVGSFPDAMALIMSYRGDDTENEAVRQLIDIIKRKFVAHE